MQRLGALWEFAEPKGGCRATAAANKTYDAFTMRCEAALVQQKKKAVRGRKGGVSRIERRMEDPEDMPVPRRLSRAAAALRSAGRSADVGKPEMRPAGKVPPSRAPARMVFRPGRVPGPRTHEPAERREGT